jgi:hypothetical protein
MDLPTCPSCGQSVLDEDSVDCPFCGSPMKGGGAGKPRKPVAAPAAKKVEAKPAATGPKGIPGKQAAGGDDDPFAVDTSIQQKAIPVSARPAPGKTLIVKCPMCDEEGYISPKSAGQLVRCANAKCKVPVFTAPVPVEAPVVVVAPKKPRLSPNAILFSVVGVVVLGALGTFFVLFNGGSGDQKAVALTEDQKRMIAEAKATREANEKKAAETVQAAAETKAVEAADPAKLAAAELATLTAQWPEQMLIAVRTTAPNRMAAGRRRAALAFVAQGNLAEARNQLDQLGKIAGAPEYEAILPLVALAWKLSEADDEAGAKELITKAAGLAPTLPAVGRFPLDCRLALAAALAANGRPEDAAAMIDEPKQTSGAEQFSATLAVSAVRGPDTLDAVDWPGRTAVKDERPRRWLNPRAAGVVLALAARGKLDEAAAFARAVTSPEARSSACLALSIVAGTIDLPRDRRIALQAKLLEAAESSRGLKARLLVHQGAWDLDAAADLRAQASRLLSPDTAKPEVPSIEGTKALLEFKLPENRPETLTRAIALAELAVSVPSGSPEAAKSEELLAAALAQARSVSPGLALLQSLKETVDASTTAELRATLKAELNLKSNDAADRKVVEYRQQVEKLLRAARERFDATLEILMIAAAGGQGEFVKTELARGTQAEALAEQEPYAQSFLPFLLEPGLVEAVPSAYSAESGRALPAGLRFTLLEQAGGNAAPADLVAALTSADNKDRTFDELGARLIARLAKTGRYPELLEFLGASNDVGFQEDAVWLAGASVGPQGALALWKTLEPRLVKEPALRAAALAGLLQGISRPAR